MKMNLKNSIGLSITFILIIIVCIGFIANSLSSYDSGTKKYFSSTNTVLENELSNLLNKQSDCDKRIENEIAKIKEYNIDNPLIIKNPYKINPLSALMIFYTEEELEVDVYINDSFMSTVGATTNHVIPIYGLENNRDNIVRLDFSDGSTRSFAIKTELYNDYTEEYDLKNSMDGSQFIFVVGDRNNIESKLRGFDQKGSLTFYYDLDYISGVTFKNNSIFVGYNSKYTKNNDIPELKLELDYLGKILSISTNLSELETISNVNLANIDYIAINHNVYQDFVDNYTISAVVDNNPTTETGVSSIDELALMLEQAVDFTNPYVLSINGRYLTYDFKGNQDVLLLLINRKGNVYTYKVDETNVIKLPDNNEFSIYAKLGNKYYSLNTTISK
jgi:hypothetical protein